MTRLRVIWAMCLAGLLVTTGCGAPPIRLVVVSQSGHSYAERFTQAYVSQDAAGDQMVVLVRDPLDAAPKTPPGQPLSPTSTALLRQVVEIQLLYRPMSGARGDSPAAINAALHWFVYTADTAAHVSLIQYSGTAFASISTSGKNADVIVRNGQASEVERHGELVDPLRVFSLQGRFSAVVDDAKVAQILSDLRQARAAASPAPAPHQ